MGKACPSHSKRHIPGTATTNSIQNTTTLLTEGAAPNTIFTEVQTSIGTTVSTYLLEGFNQKLVCLNMNILPLKFIFNVLFLHGGKGQPGEKYHISLPLLEHSLRQTWTTIQIG